MDVTAVTRMAAADADRLEASYDGVRWQAALASATTAMRNTYRPEGRVQSAAAAPPIEETAFDELATGFAVVHLAPVAGEISLGLLPHVPKAALTGLTAQGLLRAIGTDGTVYGQAWSDADDFLDAIDILVLSDEDVSFDPAAGLEYLRRAPIGVLTQGLRPVRVFGEGTESEMPVRAIVGGQRTGAGDVFAATLFVALQRTGALGASVHAAATLATRWVDGASAHPFPVEADLMHALRPRQ